MVVEPAGVLALGADGRLVRVIVTIDGVPRSAGVVGTVAAGFGLVAALVALPLELLLDVVDPDSCGTVTAGPDDGGDDTAEDDRAAGPEVPTPVGLGAARPVPQPAVSTAAAPSRANRCRARINPECQPGPWITGRHG